MRVYFDRPLHSGLPTWNPVWDRLDPHKKIRKTDPTAAVSSVSVAGSSLSRYIEIFSTTSLKSLQQSQTICKTDNRCERTVLQKTFARLSTISVLFGISVFPSRPIDRSPCIRSDCSSPRLRRHRKTTAERLTTESSPSNCHRKSSTRVRNSFDCFTLRLLAS